MMPSAVCGCADDEQSVHFTQVLVFGGATFFFNLFGDSIAIPLKKGAICVVTLAE